MHAEAVDDEQLVGVYEHGPLSARCGRQAQRRGTCAAATGADVKGRVERETRERAHRLLADARVLAAERTPTTSPMMTTMTRRHSQRKRSWRRTTTMTRIRPLARRERERVSRVRRASRRARTCPDCMWSGAGGAAE